MPAEVGIAILLSMKMVKVDDPADLAGKAKLFKREMKEGTVVYAHIKGPDEFGHDGDAAGKRRNIETIDREFFSTISEMPSEGTTLAVSCDHATPCILKMHSADPVPLLVTGRKDRGGPRLLQVHREGRKGGSLGTLRGRDVLKKSYRRRARPRYLPSCANLVAAPGLLEGLDFLREQLLEGGLALVVGLERHPRDRLPDLISFVRSTGVPRTTASHSTALMLSSSSASCEATVPQRRKNVPMVGYFS